MYVGAAYHSDTRAQYSIALENANRTCHQTLRRSCATRLKCLLHARVEFRHNRNCLCSEFLPLDSRYCTPSKTQQTVKIVKAHPYSIYIRYSKSGIRGNRRVPAIRGIKGKGRVSSIRGNIEGFLLFPLVACGSMLIPALYEKAQAPE